MAEILTIAHTDGGTAGVLADAGALSLEEWIPAEGGQPQRPLSEYKGLLILGGDENIHETDRYPYLEDEFALLSDWLESGRPVFGVCLGAQMIAHVAGGSVFEAPEREFGWIDFEVLPASLDDPVAGFGEQRLSGLLWHQYACEPPPEATILARNEVCVQSFRLGEAWAFQHHPEVDDVILDHWLKPILDGSEGPERRQLAELVNAERGERMPPWNDYGRELFRRFAERCV